MHPIKQHITTFLKSQYLNSSSWNRLVVYIIKQNKQGDFISDDLYIDLGKAVKEMIEEGTIEEIGTNLYKLCDTK